MKILERIMFFLVVGAVVGTIASILSGGPLLTLILMTWVLLGTLGGLVLWLVHILDDLDA